MESQSKTRYSSLENALRLLNLFTVRKSDWQVKEIAEKLQIAESTAHRLLTTLQSEGFIAKDVSTNTYRLGINILAFHPVIALNYPLMEKAHHILVKLKKAFNKPFK